MLQDAAFVSSIIGAFSVPDWASSSTMLGTAIDTYLKSGTVNTVVTGSIIVPPAPIAGVGVGTITTTTLSALQTGITAASASPLWDTYASLLCSAIIAHITASIVNTTDSAAATGAGVGTISVTTSSAFNTGVKALFNQGVNWTIVSTQFKNLVKALITACIVNTVDSGPSPLPWSGTGIGAIT